MPVRCLTWPMGSSDRMRTYPALIGSISIALFVGIAGCQKAEQPQATAASSEAPAAPVTAVVALARDVPAYLDEIGRTTAVESVSVMAQIAGPITASHFTEGTDVKKGDLLFEIDPRPFKAQLDKDQATLETNKQALELAKREFQRVEALKGTPAVPETEYDQKKSAVAQAEAQVQWATAAVEQSKLNLDYCQIRSPIDGRTGARLVDPGNIVKANEGSLVVVQRMLPIYADFTITEKDLPAVRHNMANGTLKTLVTVPTEGATTQPTTQASAPSQWTDAHTGDLTFIDNKIENGTGTVKLRATLPNTDRYFWPGQFVKVRLVLYTKKDAVLIPTSAIQTGQKGPYVYVIDNDSKAQMRLLTTGQEQGDMTVIDSGLSAGERIVLTGQLMVMPGGKVNVVPENAPSAPPTKTAQSDSKNETEGSRS
jgi:multidrug efflux system membrane fusion protein